MATASPLLESSEFRLLNTNVSKDEHSEIRENDEDKRESHFQVFCRYARKHNFLGLFVLPEGPEDKSSDVTVIDAITRLRSDSDNNCFDTSDMSYMIDHLEFRRSGRLNEKQRDMFRITMSNQEQEAARMDLSKTKGHSGDTEDISKSITAIDWREKLKNNDLDRLRKLNLTLSVHCVVSLVWAAILPVIYWGSDINLEDNWSVFLYLLGIGYVLSDVRKSIAKVSHDNMKMPGSFCSVHTHDARQRGTHVRGKGELSSIHLKRLTYLSVVELALVARFFFVDLTQCHRSIILAVCLIGRITRFLLLCINAMYLSSFNGISKELKNNSG